MLKKTVLCLTALLLSSAASAQMLVQFDLVAEEKVSRQSVILEGTEVASCQLTDLVFEVQARTDDQDNDQNNKIAVKIFRVTDDTKMLASECEFSKGMPASLTLEKDGKEMKLIVVAVDVE